MAFTKRNLKLYFRNRGAVVFSLLAVFILIALYALFLGEVWLADDTPPLPNEKQLLNTWMSAGILAVAGLTTTLGAYNSMVEDRARKTSRDFAASPLRKSGMLGGYLLCAFAAGLLMTLVALALVQGYVLLGGGSWFGPAMLLKTLGILVVAALANTAMMGFVVSFFGSSSAFTSASILVGTLVGFLTGIYLPIGLLPSGVQAVIKCFPPAHTALLLRQTLMAEELQTAFGAAPVAYLDGFREYMGIQYSFGGQTAAGWVSVLVLLGVACGFTLLALGNLSCRRA